MDELLVIANAQAGSAQDERLQAALDVLGEPGAPEVVRCGSPDDVDAALDRAQGRRIVVAGGDGSVHLIVKRLWERGPDTLAATELGLVPLGTGNDLATGLELPQDPADAARVCLDGTVTALDLIDSDRGEIVVNASHAGLGAAAAERSDGLKPSLGPLAYPLGALLAGVREAAWQLRVTLDGEVVHDGSTLMVGITNGPSIGGGTQLIPRALPDDGQLDLIVVSAVGPAARLAFGAALRDAAHLDRDDVLHARGLEVTVTGDAVTHDLDGELYDEWPSASYRVVPAAWRLLTPAGRPGGLTPRSR